MKQKDSHFPAIKPQQFHGAAIKQFSTIALLKTGAPALTDVSHKTDVVHTRISAIPYLGFCNFISSSVRSYTGVIQPSPRKDN